MDRIDDLAANKNLRLSEPLEGLPATLENRVSIAELDGLSTEEIRIRIIEAHEEFETTTA